MDFFSSVSLFCQMFTNNGVFTRCLHLPHLHQGRSKVHVFFCKVLSHIFHPCLCLSSPTPFSIHITIAGNLLSSILITCPNHVSLVLLILLTSVSVCSNSL